MRTLFTAACVLSLVGCGGVDESVEPTASTGQAVLSSSTRSATQMEQFDELPAPTLTWEAVWAQIGLDAKLRAQPLEARAFYTVDPGAMTPEPTTPACPACR